MVPESCKKEYERQVRPAICLRACYAIPGTDVAYRRCPVLSLCIIPRASYLRNVWKCHTWGIELADGGVTWGIELADGGVTRG
eukprot:2691138-Rhodomonas_salina.1